MDTGIVIMFTYTSIFLVSLLVAVVARMVYKSMAEKSGSVYNTKLPNAELAQIDKPVKRETTVDDGVDTAYPTDLRLRGSYAYLSDDHEVEAIDVQIAEDATHEWPQSVLSVTIELLAISTFLFPS